MNTPPTQRLSPNQNHVKTCLIIVIWYILTATSSISLKQSLSSRIITPLWASILVSIPPSLMWFLSPSIRRRASSSDPIPTRVIGILGMIQALYVLTLFISFNIEGVALTYTIKALEPVGNMCILRIIGRPTHVTRLSLLGLCILPCGIFLTQISSSVNLSGLVYALVNVILTCVRSVLVKHYTHDPSISYFQISAYGLLALIPGALLAIHDFSPKIWMTNTNLQFGVASFIGYNCASFFVLSMVDSILHGALNVFKRCITVTLSILMLSQEQALLSQRQLLGVVITFIGLGIYASGRSILSINPCAVCQGIIKKFNRGGKMPTWRRTRIGLTASLVVIWELHWLFSTSQSTFLITPHTPRRTNGKIILFGPHDRFNFGDLLFEKIVSHLLIHRNGLDPKQLVVAGLVNRSMSTFGGHPNIINIKTVTKMSHDNVRNGGDPFSIIFLGGQSLKCNLDLGIDMLETNELKQQANSSRVGADIDWDCAYLIPKDLLVPIDFPSSIKPIAIINSAGKDYIGGPCEKAVENADYVAFRDLVPNTTFPGLPMAESRPDCAVMTNILFRDTITEQTIMGQLEQIIKATHQSGYLAVQLNHKSVVKHSPEVIASVLDEAWQATNMTTVFFRAGSVPNHDLLSDYQTIADLMHGPTLIYTEENVWGVVGVIREAQAVLSTSLHVRIMAFVHNRPRLTLCSKSKLTSFIKIWDRTYPCVELAELAMVVHKALDTREAGSIATQIDIDHAIASYLEGFDRWSKLLL